MSQFSPPLDPTYPTSPPPVTDSSVGLDLDELVALCATLSHPVPMSRLDQWVEPCGLSSIDALAVVLPPQTTCGVASMTCERDVEEDEAWGLDEVGSALRQRKQSKLEYVLLE